MSETFTCFRDLGVRVVDADAHVNEPPELWQERVPEHFRDRAPRLVNDGEGDCWMFDGGRCVRPVGLNATAGLSVVQFCAEGARYADMRPGAFDAKARIEDLDLDGVHACILYPSVALEGAKVYADDRDLQLACVRAYNEWIAEFCANSDGRLNGMAVVPVTGVDDAMAEVEAALALGLRGFILSRFPNGTFDPDPDDDRLWSLVAESGLPAAIHLGSFIRPRVDRFPEMRGSTIMALAGMSKAGSSAIEMSCQLVFSGIFERIPELKIVLVESGIGWIPSLLEQLDDMFLRYRWATEFAGQMHALPSELFSRNVWTTFITDRVGLENTHRLNVSHAMWSTDYPHDTCCWPNTRAAIEQQFRGVALEDVRKMVHTNAVELYQLAIT